MNEGYKPPLEDLNESGNLEAALQEKRVKILKALFAANRNAGVLHMELLASSPTEDHLLVESALAQMISSNRIQKRDYQYQDYAGSIVYYVLDEKYAEEFLKG